MISLNAAHTKRAGWPGLARAPWGMEKEAESRSAELSFSRPRPVKNAAHVLVLRRAHSGSVFPVSPPEFGSISLSNDPSVQAHLRDLAGSAPEHCNKANVTIKSDELSSSPVHTESMFTLYCSLLSV